jgi:dTMP kinase
MFIVFEGIDGSGKTTISNSVAQALRGRGLSVEHVREGGRFASRVTQAIREFGRDARLLELTPRAELLVYVARDVQLMDEALLPALARAEVVIADRFLYTAEVLARFGRGLPAETVAPVTASAAAGLAPDLVVLIDVDPHVARARRKISKLLQADSRPSSRKGLAGTGLQQRLREGYRQMAAADPRRWTIIDNTDEDLDAVVDQVTALVERALAIGAPAAIAEARPIPRAAAAGDGGASPARPPGTPAEARDAFLRWIDRRAAREPNVAAYLLSGLYGPGIDERRLRLAPEAPRTIGAGLKGLSDPTSWELRRRLADEAPRQIALSLEGNAAGTDEAWTMRARLLPVAPAEVAVSLQGLDDERAWAMRAELWPVVPDAVMVSLALLDGPRAWQLRDRWLAERGGAAGLAADYTRARAASRSVTGLDGDPAWALREAAWEAAPVASIASLDGIVGDRAWTWRRRHLEHAPRAVLSTIGGLDHPLAWALRQALATRCREALDSMIGLDGQIAWQLREACLDVWPSTVVKSLGVLVNGARGQGVLLRQLGCYPENVSLLKHVTAIASGNQLTPQILGA